MVKLFLQDSIKFLLKLKSRTDPSYPDINNPVADYLSVIRRREYPYPDISYHPIPVFDRPPFPDNMHNYRFRDQQSVLWHFCCNSRAPTQTDGPSVMVPIPLRWIKSKRNDSRGVLLYDIVVL